MTHRVETIYFMWRYCTPSPSTIVSVYHFKHHSDSDFCVLLFQALVNVSQIVDNLTELCVTRKFHCKRKSVFLHVVSILCIPITHLHSVSKSTLHVDTIRALLSIHEVTFR